MVGAPYQLNAHANVVLGIDPQLIELIEDDIPTDRNDVRASLNTEDEDIKEEPLSLLGVRSFCLAPRIKHLNSYLTGFVWLALREMLYLSVGWVLFCWICFISVNLAYIKTFFIF